MRATGSAALVFRIALGMPGAALYGGIALLLGASAAVATGICCAMLAPMPFAGAVCTASGMASDREALR